MHLFIVGIVALFVGLASGTAWGQRIERKATPKVLFDFHLTDAELGDLLDQLDDFLEIHESSWPRSCLARASSKRALP